MRRFIHIVCFLLWTGTISGQGIIVPFHYDHELSTTYIADITQDTTGRMWIATPNHLYSFDGRETRKFTLPPDKRITSISEIRRIYADRENRIWLGLGIGIACLEQKKETFTYYLPEPDDMLSMSNILFDICQDEKGTLYFATRNGIFTTEPQTIDLKRFTDFPWHKVCSGYKKEERIVSCLTFDREGFLFAGTAGDGLSQMNVRKGIRLHFKADSNQANSIADNEIKAVFEDSHGKIWLGTPKGLSSFDRESSKFTNWNLPEVTSICETENGHLLLGLTEGCAVMKQGCEYTTPLASSSLPSPRVNVVKKDRSGGIWIGTSKGLARYQPPHDFKQLSHDPKNIHTLASNTIVFLHADPGQNSLWIGYPEGKIDLYHPGTKRMKHYQADYPGEKNIQLLGACYDREKNFFVYTNAGILKFNAGKDRFEPFTFTSDGEPLKKTYSLLEDRQGNYWLGILDKGVFQTNGRTHSLEKVDISHENIHQNIYTNIKLLHEDKEGFVWIVFWRAGILRYQPETGQEKLFTFENTQGDLPNNTVWDVEETTDGIYISTADGMAFWEFAKQGFSKQEVLSGLKNISITGILQQDSSHLWLSTNNGMIRFNIGNGNLIRFTESDGLQGKTFNPLAHARVDSLLFFGGNDGLNYIDIHTPFNNNHTPVPIVTKLKINGQEKALDKSETGKIILNLKASDQLEVSFCSFSYRKEWRNAYKFRLTGQDSIVEKIAEGNSAKLSGLEEGKYAFAISASNSDGRWSPYAEVIDLKVYGNTGYYMAGGILAVLIVAIGLLRQGKGRHKQEKSKSEKEKDDRPMNANENRLLEKFEQLMQEEHLYCNKGIRKSEIAGMLKISEQQLTLLLRKRYEKNFPELINGYRVEAVKKAIRSSENKDYTLLAIGEECGFNSKSSFYRIFKEHTGFTPAEYNEKNGNTEKSELSET